MPPGKLPCLHVSARLIKKRFDDELISLLEEFRWWDKAPKEVTELLPLLTSPDLEKVKAELKNRLGRH